MTTEQSNSGLPRPIGPQRFGALLRRRRKACRLSQLVLAGDAGISTRHLSFLENGRSLPSRDMVLRLAEALDVSMAERDAWLLAAGFAPGTAAPEIDMATAASGALRLAHTLAQHSPFPALVIDADWNIQARNAAAARLFGRFRDRYRLPDEIAGNALHVLCHPGGLRQFMPDWDDYVDPFMRQLGHEAAQPSNGNTRQLQSALCAYPGVEETIGHAGDRTDTSRPLILHLQAGEATLAFLTTFTTLTLPSAAAPGQVRLECLYPADAGTAAAFQQL